MRPFGIGLFLYLFLVLPSNAQVFLGLKGGISANNFEAPHFDDSFYDTYPNLLGGLAVEWHLSKKIAVQPEILYAGQGAEIEDDEAALKLNYLNIPILVKYYFFPKFYIGSGFQLSYLIKEKKSFAELDNEFHPTFDDEEHIKSRDIGIPVGIGYNSKANLQLELRYVSGLSNVFENPLLESKNRSVQFTVTYFWGKNKPGEKEFTCPQNY